MKRTLGTLAALAVLGLCTLGASPSSESGGTGGSSAPAPVKLIWYLRCATPKNAESVVAAANAQIQKEIGATVEMKFVSPGEYNDKMKIIMQAGEVYDLCYTASWANHYVPNVAAGAYIPLDDYIAQYPAIKALVSDMFWDVIKVNGKIYAVPNLQVMYTQMGLWFRKDVLERNGIDVSGMKSTSDLTAVYQKIHDAEPDMYCLSEPGTNMYFVKYAPEVDLDVAVDTRTWKVYDRYTTDYLENLSEVRRWYLGGFMPPDASIMKDHDALIKAGKVVSRYTRIKPGVEAELKKQYGFDVVVLPLTEPVLDKTGILSTLTAVSGTSRNPDKAVALLNLMNTNKAIYNTLVFGVEGQDYTRVSSNRIEVRPDAYAAYAWQLGNNFNAYVQQGQPDDVWEQTKKINDSATIGAMSGFSFDASAVQTERAQVAAINQEIDRILFYGLDEPGKVLQQRADRLAAAGYAKLLSEMQLQVDAWVKANVK